MKNPQNPDDATQAGRYQNLTAGPVCILIEALDDEDAR